MKGRLMLISRVFLDRIMFLFYKKIIEDCIEKKYRELVLVEPPKEEYFGDFSTNIAMILAKKVGVSPMMLAQEIIKKLQDRAEFQKLEVKAPGFINWFVPKKIFIEHIPMMLQKKYGQINLGQGKLVSIEYVSANPTGPIHAGHMRGAVSGDVLAKLLTFVGYNVVKEFYINDAGRQIEVLARSLYSRYLEQLGLSKEDFPTDGYPGEYLVEIARKIIKIHGDKFVHQSDTKWLTFFKDFAISNIMTEIREDLSLLGVNHDVFISEANLVRSGSVEYAINLLKEKGLIYVGKLPRPKGKDNDDWEEREQLLFKSTDFGDDIDRPVQKSDGSWTYFASDIAYHLDKIKRNFLEMIDFWGADHGGYVKRMQAAVLAISDGKLELEVRLIQLVKLLEGGKEAKMSKRAGTFVTARDIVDKVGKDVVRFMMLTRRDDVQLDFDFQKVVDQSKDNPVFYVQYAYARTHSVIKLFHKTFPKVSEKTEEVNWNLLDDEDMKLVKIMADWPRQIIIAARKREPHRIATFLIELSSVFHSLWNQGKENCLLRFVIPNDLPKTIAKITMLEAMQNIVESAFDIIGITPTEELK
ncbi:MAG: arginine--tRNA ligase [Holosporaceae bacterium]|nr:arginine--tRNA ligase [Holosporaceae bacterium]